MPSKSLKLPLVTLMTFLMALHSSHCQTIAPATESATIPWFQCGSRNQPMPFVTCVTTASEAITTEIATYAQLAIARNSTANINTTVTLISEPTSGMAAPTPIALTCPTKTECQLAFTVPYSSSKYFTGFKCQMTTDALTTSPTKINSSQITQYSATCTEMQQGTSESVYAAANKDTPLQCTSTTLSSDVIVRWFNQQSYFTDPNNDAKLLNGSTLTANAANNFNDVYACEVVFQTQKRVFRKYFQLATIETPSAPSNAQMTSTSGGYNVTWDQTVSTTQPADANTFQIKYKPFLDTAWTTTSSKNTWIELPITKDNFYNLELVTENIAGSSSAYSDMLYTI